MADESSLWAAKNKLQDLREQFEGVKSRLELTLDNATAILEEADDNLKHAEEGLHGDAASRPGTVRGTVRLCDSCKEIDIPNVFAALSKLKPDTEQRHLANARRTVGDLRHAVEVEDYCCLCKFLLEAILLQTAKGSFTIPPGQNEHATSIRLVSDSDPWFVTAGISVNLPPCQFGWLQTHRSVLPSSRPLILATAQNPATSSTPMKGVVSTPSTAASISSLSYHGSTSVRTYMVVSIAQPSWTIQKASPLSMSIPARLFRIRTESVM